MIRQSILALVLALIGWNAAEELWQRHYASVCMTDDECCNAVGDC